LRQHEVFKLKLSTPNVASDATSLTVGGSYSPSSFLLPSLLARFQKSHPLVQLDLRTGSRWDIERLILKNQVDLAVINNPPLNPQLTMEPYRSEPLVAFVVSHHFLAKKKQLAPEDLSRVGLIIRRHKGGRAAVYHYVRHLRRSGLEPKVIMRCDTPAAVKEAVRGKMGVGLLYRDVVAGDIDRHEFKALRMLGDAPEGKSYIIYHKKRPLSPLAQGFRGLLHQHKQNG
jgi:DNA-binding transcriptional LysR family regulator